MIRRTALGPSQKGVLFMAQNPIVTIEMEDGGVIKAELYPQTAPNTVNDFNDLTHDRGVLSMARTMAPDSAGSQFFIMVEKAPHLDGQYASFGKVIEGMEVADAIVSTKRDWNDKPRQPQRMKKVSVDTFGVDYPEPEKV